MKSLFIKPYALYIKKEVKNIRCNALIDQNKWFNQLVKRAVTTQYGKDHQFDRIKTYQDYKEAVPIVDYEKGRHYFDQIKEAQPNITWPGQPKYFAKTSGTTSGVKYIPISRDSISNHINTARSALLNYAAHHNNSKIFDGKVIFLSGSPTLLETNGIATGRLSGIVNHEVPRWIKGNQLPSYPTNCIEDWEEKLDKIVEETIHQDMRLISGIPPWVQMYFERILSLSNKGSILEVFPNLQLFVYGGVNYEPYRSAIEALIGDRIDSLETYPASEGFLAFQDTIEHKGLLLNTNSGIFYEFIPLQHIHDQDPPRYQLSEVELDKDYVLIINSNAGLWGYNLGDTVRFVSIDPYRLIVSGRVKHFISAFGEHVIAKEVEQALLESLPSTISIREFTVAPQVNPPKQEKPYHEWFIEFEKPVNALTGLAKKIDSALRNQNIYYDDLIKGGILQPLKIRPLKPNAFRTLMHKRGKLGGQNKVPRLSNDRKIANDLYNYELVELNIS